MVVVMPPMETHCSVLIDLIDNVGGIILHTLVRSLIDEEIREEVTNGTLPSVPEVAKKEVRCWG